MTDDLPLSELRDGPPPSLVQVRRRVARRRNRRRILGIAGVAAAVGLAVVLTPGVRDRGTAHVPLVTLDAVAEGPNGARPLADGALVGPDERVVFFARTSIGGTATLREFDSGQGGVPVFPVTGDWIVPDGESVPGGTSPLSWRPDRALDGAHYLLTVCPEPDLCNVDGLFLRWAP